MTTPTPDAIIEALRTLYKAFYYTDNKTKYQFDAYESASAVLRHFPEKKEDEQPNNR